MSSNTLFNRAFAGIDLEKYWKPTGSVPEGYKKIGLRYPITIAPEPLDIDVIITLKQIERFSFKPPAGIVCNSEFFSKIKEKFDNMDKITVVLSCQPEILSYNGIEIFLKAKQIEPYRVYFSSLELKKYLKEADNGSK